MARMIRVFLYLFSVGVFFFLWYSGDLGVGHDHGIGDLIAAFEEDNRGGEHNEVLEKLRALQKYFENAGRDEYGWNRTKPGETVTADRVFLGNIYGLFTHPVPFWQQKKDEKKGGWGYSGMEHLNAYDVVSEQA
ncbi:MAG: hypothetical protein G01um101430_480, partial [Parcubacteria group bacterium Gr01-1014_30]